MLGFGQTEEYEKYDAQNVIDAQGMFMCPGLIDGHIHLESTFLAPREFCSIVAMHGTSAVICDPHEIANVIGLPGIDYFLRSKHRIACQGLCYDAIMCTRYAHGNIRCSTSS